MLNFTPPANQRKRKNDRRNNDDDEEALDDEVNCMLGLKKQYGHCRR